MAFREFSLARVQQEFELRIRDEDLFSRVPSVAVRPEFAATLNDGVALAVQVGTEKARSEWVIAPFLLELRAQMNRSFGLFSGVEFNVEPARGLNGVCDFVLSRSTSQRLVGTPLMMVVEAKNDDLHTGYGRCIAEMVAAQMFNQQAGDEADRIHGCVTTGTNWQFLRLAGKDVVFDLQEWFINDPGKVMGIFRHIPTTA
jgi:hypothetical protein